MVDRLKTRWGVRSNLQFALILVAFSLAGSGVLVVKRAIFALIGVGPQTALWLKVPLWLAVVFPVYQVMLLLVGALLGQFAFFWEFEKKMLRRLRLIR